MAFSGFLNQLGLGGDKITTTEIVVGASIVWLASLGALTVVYFVAQTAISVYRAKFRAPHNLVKRYGKGWAVVTGATDGIGKAAAWHLARRGLNVLLVSRTQSKLDETKTEISEKFPTVSVKTCQVDFSNFDAESQKRVSQVLADLGDGGLAILVNNVGISYDFPMLFHELSEDRVLDMIRLNIDSTTYMTRIALNLMKDRKGGARRGAIVNIGSAAGSTSNPLLTQYSAAKAYVQRLSEGLAVEYGPLGIDVQVHVPFFIVSKLSKFKRSSFFVPTAELYGKLICDRMGFEVVVNPYLPHTLFGFIVEHLPTGPRELYTRSMHMGVRAKGMKKKAATEKKD